MRNHEAIEQEALFKWAEINSKNCPELKLMFAIPNGGRRDKKEAYFLQRSGLKAGVPDIFLPTAKGRYHGLFIELKVGKNKPTYLQSQWLKDLADQNYKTAVCYGWIEAAQTILDYLTIEQREK